MLSDHHCWRCSRETQEGKTCIKCHKAFYCSEKCYKEDQFRHNSECRDIALRFVCRGCRKTDGSMMMCSNCMKAWFCSKECLEKNFKTTHKKECKQVSESVKELAQVMQDRKKSVVLVGVVYYIGNSPAIDLLNLSMNEGKDYSDPLRLLLCGVGDPRNVCLTMSKLSLTDYLTPNSRVHFVLNDVSDCTLARTVLLLFMLWKVGSDKAESVVQVWYSLHLSLQDHELLMLCLQELVEVCSLEETTCGVMTIKDKHQLIKMKEVWKTWLSLSRKDNDLTGQRHRVFNKPSAQEGMKFHLAEIPKKHKKSMREWFEHGVLMSGKKTKTATKENVTLTGSTILTEGKFVYAINDDCLPFCGWDYKDVISAVYPTMDDVNELFNRYISDILAKCSVLLQQDQVHIDFLLCDCVEVPTHIEEGVRFDRISTSNLWDYIPLTKLFTTLKPLLNAHNKSAALITESQNWRCLFPSLEYVKMERVFSSRQFRNGILLDTGNSSIAETAGHVAFNDYVSYASEFTCFARASLLDISKLKSFIPSLDQLAAKFGFKARDFVSRGNKIGPFRWQLNCRRITLLRGLEFTVEWTLV